MESYRKKDMKAENQLAEFMDRCFYSKLSGKNGKQISFHRKEDAVSQLQGIDVELTVGGKTLYIDEKASLYYSNLMIPTFAFEIDSIQSGHSNPVDGWFINNDLKTEYYMLIWPNVRCVKKDGLWVRKDIGELEGTDFTIVEAMLIKKQKLIEKVEKLGYSQQNLVDYAIRLRKRMENCESDFSENITPEIKIWYSGKIAEKPINAVIKKDILKSVADGVYLISEDGYATIKG